MPRGVPNAKVAQDGDIAPPVQYGGMSRAQVAMASGGRWPMLKLETGARARFNFLTTGNDEWFCATEFHQVGAYPEGAEVLCLQVMTQGIEECAIHDLVPGERRLKRFGQWVWVDHILHPHDNPDQEGEAWPQVNVTVSPPGMPERKRVMFKEQFVEPEEKWRLLRLSAGKRSANFSQFTNAWMTSGNLRKHLYELQREGEALDTAYVLLALKESPLPPEVLELEEVKGLPGIPEVFRDSLSFTAGAPSNDGVMGPDEPLPAASEATGDSAPPAVQDDLI